MLEKENDSQTEGHDVIGETLKFITLLQFYTFMQKQTW